MLPIPGDGISSLAGHGQGAIHPGAPSRSFRWGTSVNSLHRVSLDVAWRALAAGAGKTTGPRTIDLSSTICETSIEEYGLKDARRAHATTAIPCDPGKRGYHPDLLKVNIAAGTGDVS